MIPYHAVFQGSCGLSESDLSHTHSCTLLVLHLVTAESGVWLVVEWPQWAGPAQHILTWFFPGPSFLWRCTAANDNVPACYSSASTEKRNGRIFALSQLFLYSLQHYSKTIYVLPLKQMSIDMSVLNAWSYIQLLWVYQESLVNLSTIVLSFIPFEHHHILMAFHRPK